MIEIKNGLIQVDQLTAEERTELIQEWVAEFNLDMDDDWMLTIPIGRYAETQPTKDSLAVKIAHDDAVSQMLAESPELSEDEIDLTEARRNKQVQDSIQGRKLTIIKNIYRESGRELEKLKKTFIQAQLAEDGDSRIEYLANLVISHQRIRQNAKNDLLAAKVPYAYWRDLDNQIESVGQGLERRQLESSDMMQQLALPPQLVKS